MTIRLQLRDQPNIGFKAITSLLLALGIGLLAWGLAHQSSEPVVLERYSPAYTLFLAIIAAVVALLAWALLKAPPWLVQVAGNTYLFLFSAVIALTIAEIALRLLNPWGIELFHTLPYHMQGMVDHPELGYVHPKSVSYKLGANRVVLNSHGLRDDEIPYATPPGENRVLVLGDSVTFGWGVSQGDTLSDRMEPRLRSLTGERWQVINAGVNGYNSEQEAAYLRIEGTRYAPDIVILIYIANDTDAVFDPNVTTWRRYATWPSSLPEFLNRIRQLSFLYQTSNLFARLNPSSDNTSRVSSVTSKDGWPRSRAALADIARRCESIGAHLLVARSSGSDPEFIQELSEMGIDAISLGSAWQQVPPAQHHVSRIDPHPSPVVHDLFAEYLVEALKARGWLDAKGEQPVRTEPTP